LDLVLDLHYFSFSLDTGARSKFSAPMFEFEAFRKQMYSLEENTCDIVGSFRRPPTVTRSDSAPGESCTPCPLVTPLSKGVLLGYPNNTSDSYCGVALLSVN